MVRHFLIPIEQHASAQKITIQYKKPSISLADTNILFERKKYKYYKFEIEKDTIFRVKY